MHLKREPRNRRRLEKGSNQDLSVKKVGHVETQRRPTKKQGREDSFLSESDLQSIPSYCHMTIGSDERPDEINLITTYSSERCNRRGEIEGSSSFSARATPRSRSGSEQFN